MTSPTVSAFADVVEQAPDGVDLVNDGGLIVYANARIADLFGFAPADLLGRPVEGLIPQRVHQQHAGHRGAYTEQPRVRAMCDPRVVLFGRRMDGSEFPDEIHFAPVYSHSRH